MNAELTRQVFCTSRLLDFFSEKELIAQTGHARQQWPLVIVKELVDNALDACEEAGIPPQIEVTVNKAGITVADNGLGIAPNTVAGVLDYSIRVSSREAYVAPDRGAQGNALKTIVAMPFVLDGEVGRLSVTGQGVGHKITVRVDPIRQQPMIGHEQHNAERNSGTSITVHWPNRASSVLDEARSRFYNLIFDYAWLNPHLRLIVDWHGDRQISEPTDAAWSKWRPSEPTSPHWYTTQHLERLVAAYVTHETRAEMTVREFVSEFRGLSGSAKGRAVLTETGMDRTRLADLANGRLDTKAIGRLLDAMQKHSRPVRPARLGVIGREHMSARMAELGCERDSFNYKKVVGDSGSDPLPWVVEVAFGWCPNLGYRRLISGVNWSPGIGNPFRTMGRYGQSLDTLLQRQRVDEDCVMVVHLACPRVEYTDRGKSAVVIR